MTIWDYKDADVGFIEQALKILNCQYAFESKKRCKFKKLMKRYKFIVKY